MRAARARTCRMPRPVKRTLSPFFRCEDVTVTSSSSTDSACFFDISWLAARPAAICFSVTVAPAAVLAAAFLTGAAAFLAGTAFLAAGMGVLTVQHLHRFDITIAHRVGQQI